METIRRLSSGFRSLRSLFLGRTHPKPVRPIVGAQRAHVRRGEEQVATFVLAERNRRPTVAAAANVARPAIGIVATPRHREEDGFIF